MESRGACATGGTAAEGARMTLLADLDASLQEHRRCGDLDGVAEDNQVWMMCTCGARIERDADRD